VNLRRPEQVVQRALILGAISFRASLEVTDHPRVVELSLKLLPWLHDLGCDGELDPIERELLATPLGQLTDTLKIDANWAGEQAAFFCWTLKLLGPLEVSNPADQSELPGVLSILQSEASAILRSASLREVTEIKDACRQFVLIRSMLQESRVGPPASEIVRRLNLQRLDEAGLAATGTAVKQASETVAAMTPDERDRAAGLYFVRDHAALWLFSNRPTYFESEE
jgi:hypothetical protein